MNNIGFQPKISDNRSTRSYAIRWKPRKRTYILQTSQRRDVIFKRAVAFAANTTLSRRFVTVETAISLSSVLEITFVFRSARFVCYRLATLRDEFRRTVESCTRAPEKAEQTGLFTRHQTRVHSFFFLRRPSDMT